VRIGAWCGLRWPASGAFPPSSVAEPPAAPKVGTRRPGFGASTRAERRRSVRVPYDGSSARTHSAYEPVPSAHDSGLSALWPPRIACERVGVAMYAELLAETVTEVDREPGQHLAGRRLLQGPWTVSATQAVDLRRSLRASRVRSAVRQGAHQTEPRARCRDVSQPVRLSRRGAGTARRTARLARPLPARLHRIEGGAKGLASSTGPPAAVRPGRHPVGRMLRFRVAREIGVTASRALRHSCGPNRHAKDDRHRCAWQAGINARPKNRSWEHGATENCRLRVCLVGIPMGSSPCRHEPQQRRSLS